MRYRSENVELDTQSIQLFLDGVEVPVEPMVFDLIAYFFAHPRQIHSRDALINSVWKGRVVSDSTVATCIKSARKALGDDGNQQRFIETVRNRGFRFVADVTGSEQHSGETSSKESWQPTLRVNQFDVLDGVQKEILPRQLVAELSLLLARIPLLDIYDADIPIPTSGAHNPHDLTLHGSIDTQGGTTRVHGILSETTGRRCWAGSFEFPEPDATAMANTIVGKLEPQIYLALYKALAVSEDAMSAKLLFLKAHSLLVAKGWHHDSFNEAIKILERVIVLDEKFALGHAMLSLLVGFGSRVGLQTDTAVARDTVVKAADLALDLDGMNSTVLGYVGCSLADVGFADRGEALLRNAIDINPANAQAIAALGAVKLVQRDVPSAIEFLSQGIDLAPSDPRLSIWGATLSLAFLMAKQIPKAIEVAELACRRNDQTYMPRVALAAAHLASGNSTGAKAALSDAKRIKPDISVEQLSALVGKDVAGALMALG